MANEKDRRPVQQSLLDRLLDDDPEKELETPPTARQLERLLRDAMRRDVESFLNTRRRCVPLPEGLSELPGTVADYGIPDFVGYSLSSERERKQFLSRIAGYLKQHEPRFKSVDLELTEGVDDEARSLHFRIEAVVYAEPAPESLVFDSRVEPVSRSFSVVI